MNRSRAALAGLIWVSLTPAWGAEILTLDGLPPVAIGMTVAQAEKALGKKLDISSDASGDEAMCATAGKPGDDFVAYMFHDHRVVRIDVTRKGIATAQGAGVGTTEDQLRKLYGPKARFSPHPYLQDTGHYVTITVAGRKLIFETEDGVVHSFRVGLTGPVDYIEGCA